MRADPTFATQTGSDGTFALKLVAGRSWLQFEHDTLPMPAGDSVATLPGQHVHLGDLDFRRPVTVSGRVVDAHGLPVPAVWVRRRWRGEAGTDDSALARAAALTDEGGHFVLRQCVAFDEAWLVIEKVGWRTRTWTVQVGSGVAIGGAHDAGAVVLEEGGTTRGVVRRDSGAPVAGALVCVLSAPSFPLTPYPERGVTTGADGRFELRGLGPDDLLYVCASGFVTAEVAHADAADLDVCLQRLATLRGRVRGADWRRREVILRPARGLPGLVLPSRRDFLGGDVAVAADGTFTAQVPAGTYELMVRVDGIGATVPRTVEVPGAEVLDLAVAEMAVEVVDDLGTPLTGAEVTVKTAGFEALLAPPGGPKLRAFPARVARTDDRGRARLAVPISGPVLLAARSPAAAETLLMVPDAAGAGRCRIALQRLGRIEGRVLEPSLVRAFSASVACTRHGEAEEPVSCTVDATGAFLVLVPPGEYLLALSLEDDSSRDELDRPRGSERALLGGEVVVARKTVTVAAAETVAVTWTPPRLGEVRGRVTRAGQPVAGVVVFAWKRDEWRSGPGIDVDEPWRLQPRVATDANGAFTFAVARPGSFELYARVAGEAITHGPVCAAVAALDVPANTNIELSTARVRGRCAVSDVGNAATPEARNLFVFRRTDAARDPFFAVDSEWPQRWGMSPVPVAEDGAFVISGLPVGDYVLRALAGDLPSERIEWQVPIHSDGCSDVDLGTVATPTRFDLRVPCAPSPPRTGAWLQEIVGDGGPAVFARAVMLEGDVLAVQGLKPGRYRVQRFECQEIAGEVDPTRTEFGTPVVLEVGADGSVTPVVLEWSR